MRKKEISETVLKISDNVFSSLIDLFLWNIFYFAEISVCGGRSSGHINKAFFLADKDLQNFNSSTIKRTIDCARQKGFIKGDFTLTKEGRKRLDGMLPGYFGRKKWDGNWYLVIYDIPEQKRFLRDILRNNLKQLGFGELQASVWVSPFNFFGEIEQLADKYKISPYIVLAITNKLGREEAKRLAEKVWHLEKINDLYKDLFSRFAKAKDKNVQLYYFNILKMDPQLPKELLPSDWQGEEGYKTFCKPYKIIH